MEYIRVFRGRAKEISNYGMVPIAQDADEKFLLLSDFPATEIGDWIIFNRRIPKGDVLAAATAAPPTISDIQLLTIIACSWGG